VVNVLDFLPFFCLGAFGLLVFFAVYGFSQMLKHNSRPDHSSSSQGEIEHIDYLLGVLEEAREEGEIDPESYGRLRERYVRRRAYLVELRFGPASTMEDRAAEGEQPKSQDSAVFEARPEVDLGRDHIGAPPEGPSAAAASQIPASRAPLTLARVTRWLLYLGVFLLFVATVIFAVYKWQSFSDTLKFAILLAVTAAFHAGGWLVDRRLKIRLGGLALVSVGAVMTFFDGYMYLAAKGTLGSLLAWSYTIAVCSLIYLAVALMMRSRLFVYATALAQAAAVSVAGANFIEKASGAVPFQYAFLETLLALAVLFGLWLLACELLSTRDDLRDLFRRPLLLAANVGVGTILLPYLLVLAFGVLVEAAPLGLVAVVLAIDAVLAAFFVGDWLITQRNEHLHPALLTLPLAVVSVARWAGLGRTIPLLLAALALAWVVAAVFLKLRGPTRLGLLRGPLANSGYVVAAVVALYSLAGMAEDIVRLELLQDGGNTVKILTLFALSAVFFVGSFYRGDKESLYAGLFFLAGSYSLLFIRLFHRVDYLPAVLAGLALLWQLAAWWLRERGVKSLAPPLAYGGYVLAATIGVIELFSVAFGVIERAGSLSGEGLLPPAASNDVLAAFLALTVFFAVALAFWRHSLDLYPALVSVTATWQLLYVRTGLDLAYVGLATSILALLFIAGGTLAGRWQGEEFRVPLVLAAQASAVYGLFLSLTSQPALIAVLLVCAGLALALALTEENEIAYLWTVFGQVALALVVSLDYAGASHLEANVAYVALYLGVFGVSLVLRQLELSRAKRWASQMFTFAALFCAAELALQLFAALGGVDEAAGIPGWLYAPGTGPDILALAFVIGGFFYLTASFVYDAELLVFAGFGLFLAAYLTRLAHTRVSIHEWYSVPIGVYVLSMGYLHERSHPESGTTALSNPLGLLIVLGASTIAFMSTTGVEAQLHAILGGLLSLAFLLAGAILRTKAFFFGGVLFLAWNALYQSWDFLYALPKWVTIGGLGLALLLSAIYMERRRERVLELFSDAKKTFVENWR